jgi:peptide chain release factor 1
MQEDIASNMDQYRKLTREHAEINPLVTLYASYQQANEDIQAGQEMLADPEMKEFAQEEIANAKARMEELALDLQKMLLPKDANDERNIFLEIRAGTGGDESALFAGDLLRMYTRFAERNRWQIEMVSESPSEIGGYKEVIIRILGHGVYSKLKFESGGHRVQRVPATETQGRIHTSACTVAVMPEADEINDVHINPADLRIDTYRSSGAGGQYVNKTESAIRITHKPSGLVVTSQTERSQLQNKENAMSLLAARLLQAQQEADSSKLTQARREQIGWAKRAEKTRTYNYPQNRITDHRIGKSWHNLEDIVDGNMEPVFKAFKKWIADTEGSGESKNEEHQNQEQKNPQ